MNCTIQKWIISIFALFYCLLAFTEEAMNTTDRVKDVSATELSKHINFSNHSSVIPLTEAEKSWLKAHPVIKVGGSAQLEPLMTKNAEGKVQGITVDLFKSVESDLGVRFEFIEDDWNIILRSVSNKKIDVAGWTSASASAKYGHLRSNNPLNIFLTFYGKHNLPIQVNNLSDLKSLRIGYFKDVVFLQRFIARHGKDFIPIKSDSFSDAISLLQAGKIDLVAGLGSDAYMLSNYYTPNIDVVYVCNEYVIHGESGIRPDWPELQPILNKAMMSVSQAQLARIYNRWSVPQKTKSIEGIKFTEPEKEWLKAHPTVTVASDPEWAPVEFVDDNGVFRGIAIDYLKYFEKALGIKFVFSQDRNWDSLVAKAKNRELDLMSCIEKTPNRSKDFSFTKPFINIPNVIFCRDDVHYISGLPKLSGKKVAVVKGYALQEWIERDHPYLDIVPVDSIADGMKKLQGRDVDAFLGCLLTGGYYLKHLGYSSIKITGEVPYPNIQRIGIRPDWPELVSILDKLLVAMPQHKKDEIYDKWISIPYVQSFDMSTIYKSLIPVLLIIIIVIYWNRRLSTEVSKRVEIEDSLKTALQVAEQASKAKSEFLSNMSHEIRTPMNAVLGFTSVLIESEDNPKKLKSLQTIRTSGQALLNLINNILDLSKVEAGKVEVFKKPTSVITLLKDIDVLFSQAAANKGLLFSTEINGNLPEYLLLDESRLRQILVNLVGNALKFTHTGFIRMEACFDNGVLNISVVDSGIGISGCERQKIFDSFEQAQGGIVSDAGTGLGLSISRKLVELMGGSITAESELHKGSKFSIILNDIEVSECSGECCQNMNSIDFSKIDFTHSSILIVDDVADNREMIKKYLEGWDFKLVEATNGKEAIALAKKHKPDLILMDIRMPVMNGYEAIEMIKGNEFLEHIPVISLTASALKHDEELLRKLCDGYLRKPVSKEDLVRGIMKFLQFEVIQDSSINKKVVKQNLLTRDVLNSLPDNIYADMKTAIQLGAISDFEELLNQLGNEHKNISAQLQALADEFELTVLKELFV